MYVVAYDISDSKRWRRVFRLLKGFGHWIQLSVFQCRLTARRKSEMMEDLTCIMNMAEDHILIMDMGPADRIGVNIESLGKPYKAPKRQATIV